MFFLRLRFFLDGYSFSFWVKELVLCANVISEFNLLEGDGTMNEFFFCLTLLFHKGNSNSVCHLILYFLGEGIMSSLT